MPEATFSQLWNGLLDKERVGQRPVTWKDLAQAAYKKQLASKERPPRRTASQKLTTTRQGSRLTER